MDLACETAAHNSNTSSNNPIRNVFSGVQSQASRWFRHISEAAEAYKTRDGKNRRPESTGPSMPLSTPDNEASENAQDKTKDTEENKESSATDDLLVPAGGSSNSNSTQQDTDPSTASTNENAQSIESATTTPQASPLSATTESGEPLSKKMGDGMLSPAPQRRRVEPLRLTTEENPLIQPSEVVVSQRSVLTAEPVLTPIEQLRRKDEAIRLALAEKQQLVADILHVPREEFENIADLAGEPSADKEATELILAAVNQANQLASVLNEALRVTEEEALTTLAEVVPGSSPRPGRRLDRLPGVPAHKLQGISMALNTQLTQLLKIIKDRDEERERLRRELQRSREQLHVMHESHRRNLLNITGLASPLHSRPNSFVSQEGSCEPHHDSEDNTGLHRSSEQDMEILGLCDMGSNCYLTYEQHDDMGPDVFVDALSGEAVCHLEGQSELMLTAAEEDLDGACKDLLPQKEKTLGDV